MIINGVELDFRLYDMDNQETSQKYRKILDEFRHISDKTPKDDAVESNKYICRKVKEMFDTLFGEHTGDDVCGAGNDILACMEAYEALVNEQIRQDEAWKRFSGIVETKRAIER